MLSYMLPVEEKSPTARNLSLNLNNSNNTSNTSDTSGNNTDDIADDIDENTKLLIGERGNATKENLNNNLNCNKNHNHLNGGLIKTNGDIKENGDGNISKKGKLTKVGNKNVTLKRVSFGSSKGSMVETLVFETPTPLPEHSEREFFSSITTNGHHLYHQPNGMVNGDKILSNGCLNNNANGLDDSGIELQEESERSKVRVTFFQSSKPQQISPPETNNHNQLIYFGDNNNLIDQSSQLSYILNNNNYYISNNINNNINNNQHDSNDLLGLGGPTMAATDISTGPQYDRQISTESGWDNPFRPGGDLSREADEIVNMIKGGKPITPTGDHQLLNGDTPNDSHGNENGHTVIDGVTKLEASQLQSTQKNGTKSPQKLISSPLKNGSDKPSSGATTTPSNNNNQTQISNQVIPGPQSVSHVVIDEKKKKKCHCCVVQ